MIEFRNIGKSFGGVPVLRNVSLSVSPGATLGLVGENGAGKSTLMNVLGGNLLPDTGSMLLQGAPYSPSRPADAERAGIGFIHQELSLFPNLSIAENLFLTSLPRRWGLLRTAEANSRARALLKRVGLSQEPQTKVDQLSAGERQLVEIARALGQKAKLIIFDEPTTSLSSPEAERLFSLIGELRESGVSMIYISHTLADMLRLCSQVVVLRDGQVAGWGAAADFDVRRLVSLMVGRSLNQLYPSLTRNPSNEVFLEARRVSQPGVVRNISFELHRGEVLGLAGLMGAGRSELARILFGLDPFAAGEVRVHGKALRGGPRRRVENRVAFLTENRREEGLCMEASIAENMALVALRNHTQTPLGILAQAPLRGAVAKMREAVRLTPTAPDRQPVKALSGGNQQKVVLGKWLLAHPSVLILDEPTRGIDVGAKFEIYQFIDALAARGAGVLVISSELEELIGVCDRILVMRRGELADELPRAEFNRERILRAALHT